MAYLEDHSLRFELDRVLRDRIEATARRVLQIGLFERIGVLRDGSGEGAQSTTRATDRLATYPTCGTGWPGSFEFAIVTVQKFR